MTYVGAWATIQRTVNGWIIWGPRDVPPEAGGEPYETFVSEDHESGDAEVRSLQSALFQVVEFLSAAGTRHDVERISIDIVPGDKYIPPDQDSPVVEVGGDSP